MNDGESATTNSPRGHAQSLGYGASTIVETFDHHERYWFRREATQLGKDAAEAEASRAVAIRQLGKLIGPAVTGRPKKTSQKEEVKTSQKEEVLTHAQWNRRHRDVVEDCIEGVSEAGVKRAPKTTRAGRAPTSASSWTYRSS